MSDAITADYGVQISGALLVMLAGRMVLIVRNVSFLQPLFVSVGAATRNTVRSRLSGGI